MTSISSVQAALKEDEALIAPYQHLSELPLVVAAAHGPYLKDPEGREYLDFTSGACTMNLGYDVLPSAEFASFPFPYAAGLNQLKLASHLVRHYPGLKPEEVRCAFGVCGSEANDAAIKLCRAYTKRRKIVTFKGDYHGTTFGAVSMTTLPGRISDKFAPLLGEIYVLPFCDEHADDNSIDECLNQLAALDYETIAGFIIETVQGDMGMLPMHPRLMQTIYQLSRSYGIAFAVDEVQMAFFRTGPFFAIENYPGVIPDAILMGKHLGGGIPLSCVMGRKEFMSSLGRCEHAFSMAGNSEACARGLAALEVIEKEGFKAELEIRMTALKEGLASLMQRHPNSTSRLTGRGFAFGLWVKSPDPELKDDEAAYLVMRKAFDLGLYTMRLGSSWLRIEPQLNLSVQDLKAGLMILDEALSALDKGEIDKTKLSEMMR